jgi:uncharacterized membrane-anchored protein
MLHKIICFWIMKICATTLGETGGDLMSMTLHVGYAISSLILIGLFFIALITQLKVKKFHPSVYWMVILATSTAGTTMSDYMDRTLGLGYATGSLILTTILIIIFALWKWSGESFSVQTIKTLKGEMMYWTAILFSNTLGTALGDFLADNSGLGFAGGALLIASMLGLIILATYFTKISKTLLFWMACVLTRPFGATFGDFFTKSRDHGGLGFGTIGTSLILAIILGGFIVYTQRQESKGNP